MPAVAADMPRRRGLDGRGGRGGGGCVQIEPSATAVFPGPRPAPLRHRRPRRAGRGPTRQRVRAAQGPATPAGRACIIEAFNTYTDLQTEMEPALLIEAAGCQPACLNIAIHCLQYC